MKFKVEAQKLKFQVKSTPQTRLGFQLCFEFVTIECSNNFDFDVLKVIICVIKFKS